MLGTLQKCLPLSVVTNCSEQLGQLAAARTGINFVTIVTAERGYYKLHCRPYRLALSELTVEPEECLFVAGSAYDLYGASVAGLLVFWHDRIGMRMPPGAPPPLARHDRLYPLQKLTLC